MGKIIRIVIALFVLSATSVHGSEQIPLSEQDLNLLFNQTETGVVIFDFETTVIKGGYSVCQGKHKKYINCGKMGCDTGDTFISYSPNPHPNCIDGEEPVKTPCNPKDAWTGWVTVGSGVGNPCPGHCKRGDEIGLKGPRSVGFPIPKIQFKHKFECLVP